MSMPVIVCLKSEYNNKYLRCYDNNDTSAGFLQFSGESPYEEPAQFEVVHAKLGCGLSGFIHLKSCYTNKYFVRQASLTISSVQVLQPTAEEPNENQKEWSCTLFKPTIIEDNNTTMKVRLTHVQLNHYVALWIPNNAYFHSCLYVPTVDKVPDPTMEIINFVDYSSIFKLPKNIVFKGDNGKYLGAFPFNGKAYLQFSFDNPNDPEAAHEVFTSRDDTIYIKSKHFDKFWRVDKDDMIVADGVDKSGDAMFRPKFIDVNVVALLNLQKTRYAKRYTSPQHGVNLLSVQTSSVDDFAKLQVKDLEEPK